MNKSILFVLFLLCVTMVYAYDYNGSTNFTMILNPDSVTLLPPSGVAMSWNTSVYGTYVVPMNYSAQCMDLNASNYTAYFAVLRDEMLRNLTPIIQNSTTNIPKSFQDNLEAMIYTYISNGLSNATNDMQHNLSNDFMLSIGANCNYTRYQEFVEGIFMNRILQNLTDFDTLQKDLSACVNERDISNLKLDTCEHNVTDLTNGNKYRTIIIGVLLALIALLAYSIWGGGRGDIFDKIKWKRKSAKDLRPDNSTVIITPGSKLLDDAK